MALKTFNDIFTLTKQRIKFTDADDVIDAVINNAINHCYMNILAKEDKRLSATFIPIVNGIAQLPDDLISIEKVTPALSDGDTKVGNSIITDKTGTLTLIYAILRDPLVNDTDEPDMSKKYFYPISTYACYAYYMHKKKLNEATVFKNDFDSSVLALRDEVNVNTQVQQVYGW